MQSLFAYMLSVWCYVVAIVAILWLVPHVCRKYGLGAQVCVLLLAMASVVVGYEAWSVAEVKSLKDRLDAQLLRQAEAKSNFDLFNEHFLKSREQK